MHEDDIQFILNSFFSCSSIEGAESLCKIILACHSGDMSCQCATMWQSSRVTISFYSTVLCLCPQTIAQPLLDQIKTIMSKHTFFFSFCQKSHCPGIIENYRRKRDTVFAVRMQTIFASLKQPSLGAFSSVIGGRVGSLCDIHKFHPKTS